jgi:hypothetical protein
MDLRDWSKSEVDYGRKILDSGLEGARSGEEEFLHARPLTPFVNESVRKALTPAVLGACLGMLSGYPANGHRSIGRMLMFGLLGGAIGFGTGVAWESRELTASAARGALRNIHKVRDERWVEKHPVAYA